MHHLKLIYSKFVFRRGAIQGLSQEDQTWTTFLMDMRDHSEFPNAEDFDRFLATSLSFTGNLRELSVYFNDKRIIRITKKMSDPRTITIFSDLNTTSTERISVDKKHVRISRAFSADMERIKKKETTKSNYYSDDIYWIWRAVFF
ncbi:2730_t:CDS:2 [Cetraspora pellucida]|uniref:2730_t:CDS:1 n=1 Tax=Cetraspora pellucida TaxID=1433469 RepID=A0ACA9NRZ3_9GLOM|nr:2730_t:CDS:2 [Cetraspora pellucida]